MDIDELRRVQRTERQRDSLQHLRDSFYADVAAYVAELKRERSRKAEEADDPFSAPEVTRLTDRIETAEEVAEAIYDRRVGKVVKLASFAAAGMTGADDDADGLTSEERALYDDLVARIEANRGSILDMVSGTGSTDDRSTPDDRSAPDERHGEGETDRPAEEGEESRRPVPQEEPADEPADEPTNEPSEGADDPPPVDDVLADAMGGESRGTSPVASDDRHGSGGRRHGTGPDGEPSGDPDRREDTGSTDRPDPTGPTDRTTVRITEDVGPIFGVDEREYDLAREDVVTLPSQNAKPLLDRDAAERID